MCTLLVQNDARYAANMIFFAKIAHAKYLCITYVFTGLIFCVANNPTMVFIKSIGIFTMQTMGLSFHPIRFTQHGTQHTTYASFYASWPHTWVPSCSTCGILWQCLVTSQTLRVVCMPYSLHCEVVHRCYFNSFLHTSQCREWGVNCSVDSLTINGTRSHHTHTHHTLKDHVLISFIYKCSTEICTDFFSIYIFSKITMPSACIKTVHQNHPHYIFAYLVNTALHTLTVDNKIPVPSKLIGVSS